MAHNSAMHLLITHAHSAAVTPNTDALAAHLKLPNLQQLLARLNDRGLDKSDPYSLNMPHERVLAHLMGLSCDDGRFPGASLHMAAQGLDAAGRCWAEITPVHWTVGLDQISMGVPENLRLSDDESRALFNAVQPLLSAQGWQLQWGAALRWYATHELLQQLATASIDRAIGQDVDDWLPDDSASAKELRRLQNEVQMLLYRLAVNRQRRDNGEPDVNSIWLSGCGILPAQASLPQDLVMDDSLRLPSLQGDGPAWLQTWQTLDAGPIATLLEAYRSGQMVQLTLSGSCGFWQWQGQKRLWGGIQKWFHQPPEPVQILAAL
jgi:hypothetical protein